MEERLTRTAEERLSKMHAHIERRCSPPRVVVDALLEILNESHVPEGIATKDLEKLFSGK